MKSVLIVGGNGYVGSCLYARLQGKHIVASVDLCLFGQDLGYSLHEDLAHLQPSFLEAFEYVIVLAAHSSVSLGQTDPQGAILNNVTNMIQLQQKLNGRQKLIYASSTSVYGSGQLNCTEQHQTLQAHNYYDISKQVCDVHMKHMIDQGHAIAALRFGTICGSNKNMRGDLVLNSMTLTALKQGSFWYNNPHIHRSILHVQDAAGAIQQMIDQPFVPGIYNIKSFDVSIEQAALMVETQSGCHAYLQPNANNGYDFTVCDDLFNNTYAYVPQHTLESTVRDLIDNAQDCHVSYRNTWPQNQGQYVL